MKFTAQSIIYNINTYLSFSIDEVILSGGGAHHALLVKDLNENLSNLYLHWSLNSLTSQNYTQISAFFFVYLHYPLKFPEQYVLQ